MADELKSIKKGVQSTISDYCEENLKLEMLEDTIKQEGASAVFKESLKKLEGERNALAGKVNLSEEEIVRYADLENLRSSLKMKKTSLEQELSHLKEI